MDVVRRMLSGPWRAGWAAMEPGRPWGPTRTPSACPGGSRDQPGISVPVHTGLLTTGGERGGLPFAWIVAAALWMAGASHRDRLPFAPSRPERLVPGRRLPARRTALDTLTLSIISLVLVSSGWMYRRAPQLPREEGRESLQRRPGGPDLEATGLTGFRLGSPHTFARLDRQPPEFDLHRVGVGTTSSRCRLLSPRYRIVALRSNSLVVSPSPSDRGHPETSISTSERISC